VLSSRKNAFQALLRRHGIELRKAPARFEPIPVFTLAVEALMARRGDGLHFVQVGANDGVFSDPLRKYLLSHGWHGVLVEPQPLVFERLKVNYAACADRLIFENLAISTQPSLTLHLPPPASDGRGMEYAESVVSTHARLIANQIGRREDQLRKFVVPAMTLDLLFAKHGIDALDLLQIDAEGYGWQVLQTLNLATTMPTLIQLETGLMARQDLSAMAGRLQNCGYLFFYGGMQGDALAIRKDFLLD